MAGTVTASTVPGYTANSFDFGISLGRSALHHPLKPVTPHNGSASRVPR